MATNATKMRKALEPPPAPTHSADGRPYVRIEDGDFNAAARTAAQTLTERVYMRDTVPMVVSTAAVAGGRNLDDETVEIRGVAHRRTAAMLLPATPGRVQYLLDQHVAFLKWSKSDHEYIATRCPDPLVARVVGAPEEMGFRPCAGVVNVPLFRNGELVTTQGWDAASQLILDVPTLPAIAARPTRNDALTALGRLLRPFRGFIEPQTVDRVALTAAVMTAVLRPSLQAAPAILFDGNLPGVGKGKIARSLSVLTGDGLPAVITEGHNDEETEKRISAAIISGVPVVVLDNLQRHVASSALESALTEATATIRVFGKLQNLRIPCRTLILLTANNATLRRDMLRRTLPVRILVPAEAPEDRYFDFDPVAEVCASRAEMLASAFTIARAWWLVRNDAEQHRHVKTLGSFAEWSELVGGLVSWLCDKHPVDLIAERRSHDPHLAAEHRVIEALHRKYGTETFRAAQAATDLSIELWAEVLSSRAGDKQPGAKAVGIWLRTRKDRVFGRWILGARIDRKDVAEWSLTEVAQ